MKRLIIAAAIACLAAEAGLSADSKTGISGKWHFVLQTEGGDRERDADFQQDGNKVTGKWADADVQGTFENGKLDLGFPITSEEAGKGTLRLQGELTGDSLTGTWAFQAYSGSFKATRDATVAGDADWKQLFNGKDLSDWKHVGPGYMSVEDGLIRTHGGMGLLYWTGGAIGDCTLRVVYKMRDQNDNSGVFIRIPSEPTEPWMPVNKGYEVQIDNIAPGEDEYHITGTLYSLTKPLSRPGKPGPEWNTMDITLDGPRTMVVVNGEKVTDYTEGQPVPPKKLKFEPDRGRRPDRGWFGLQNHSDNDVVFFKEVALKSSK